MPAHGGRTAIVGVEVLEARDSEDRLVHRFVVGVIERVTPFTIDAARERVIAMVTKLQDARPCCIVDTGTPQGLALRASMSSSRDWPRDLHRPHAYPGTGARNQLFAAFLEAYSRGEVRFAPGLENRADLDKALVFYHGGGTAKEGFELESEDEALVIALGLAMFWPRHGASAASFAAGGR